jgi:hypothetical protein
MGLGYCWIYLRSIRLCKMSLQADDAELQGRLIGKFSFVQLSQIRLFLESELILQEWVLRIPQLFARNSWTKDGSIARGRRHNTGKYYVHPYRARDTNSLSKRTASDGADCDWLVGNSLNSKLRSTPVSCCTCTHFVFQDICKLYKRTTAPVSNLVIHQVGLESDH